jgi:hypothetical protein
MSKGKRQDPVKRKSGKRKRERTFLQNEERPGEVRELPAFCRPNEGGPSTGLDLGIGVVEAFRPWTRQRRCEEAIDRKLARVNKGRVLLGLLQ